MPKVAPFDNVIRQLARNRADKVRQAFADNPSNRYSVMKQMEDDIQSIGSSPYVEPWLREESVKHGIPILDRETGKCIYNCR